jgi:hypothetical protein
VTLSHSEGEIDGEAIFDIIADDLRRPRAVYEARRRPANRRDPQILSSRQPCEHVDPRGGDDLDRGADNGSLQQPRVVQAGRKAKSAESWSWDEDHARLTFKLRQGVKWHDGKPFTASDVKCTWDMLTGKSQDKLRLNPRKAWYRNLEGVVPEGDHAVTFELKGFVRITG